MTPPLTDSFGRKHEYLRISLTEKCNLRCVYCMPEEGIPLKPAAHYMQREELTGIASEFVRLGIKKIRLTGGEPLVRKDAAAIMEDLAALGAELAITTNGVIVDRFLDTFRSCGIRSVNVSLDTFREERMLAIARRDYFHRIMDNIRLLLSEGFRVKLNAVIIKGMNDDELPEFIRFTEHHPVEFRFIEFMPFSGNKWDKSRCISHKEILSLAEQHYGSKVLRQIDGPNDTARHYRINGYAGSFAIISSVTNPFCDTCNRLRLTADGRMKNCLFSTDETDLLSAFRRGDDLEPLIRDSVLHKKSVRAGLLSDRDMHHVNSDSRHRAMIAIGG